MYHYRVYNKYSTKLSEVMNEHNEPIGYIRKVHTNGIIKLIDYIFNGNMFPQFEVLDLNKEIVLKAKKTNPLKWRKYDVTYYCNGDTHKFVMKQKNFFKFEDVTEFNINNKQYSMAQQFGKWAELIDLSSGKTIAKWKIKFKNPFFGHLDVLDENYEAHRLLLLGIFHSYFYGE